MAILRKPRAVRIRANKRLMQQAAPKPIRIVCLRLSLAAPQTCLSITPCPTSCASHDVGECIVRGQAVGLARRPGQIMGVGLGTTDTPCRETAWLKIRDSSIIAPVNMFRCPQRRSVAMRCQLLDRERRAADSAGKASRRPRKLRQPPDQDVRIMNERA